jgi:hypothetical protein
MLAVQDPLLACGHVLADEGITRYKLGRLTIKKILQYNAPERTRISRTRRPSLFTDLQVDEIIKYASKSWDYKVLNYSKLYNELGLKCSILTLKRRLK